MLECAYNYNIPVPPVIGYIKFWPLLLSNGLPLSAYLTAFHEVAFAQCITGNMEKSSMRN